MNLTREQFNLSVLELSALLEEHWLQVHNRISAAFIPKLLANLESGKRHWWVIR